MTVPDLLDPELLADPYTGFGPLREQAATLGSEMGRSRSDRYG